VPVERFVQLVQESETLRGFDTTPVAPIFADGIREDIMGGMETDVIYLPAVVKSIVDAYRDEVTTTIELGILTLSTYADLPFKSAIFFAMKHRFGETLRARTWFGQFRELS
jgi:hypothetical protein